LPPRLVLPLLFVLLTVLSPRPVWAWIELAVRADNVVLDVAPDGSGIVAHEMLLHIRGGPLKTITLDGVDTDAVPMPDATVTRAQSGRLAGVPIPLTVEASEGKLQATIQLKGGLRGGTYLVRLRYRTDLKTRIAAHGGWALLRWQGPRHPTGIDTMRVLFRLPRGKNEPRLPGGATGESAVVEEAEGVFLATVRRGDAIDEMEIVRPHVARGEEVIWRTLVDPGAFDPKLTAAAPEPIPGAGPPKAKISPVTSADPLPWIVAAIAGLLYGLLVGMKGRAVARVCEARRARPRSLVPVSPLARGLGAGLCLSGAVAAAWATPLPLLAAGLLAMSMAFATSLPPVARTPLRGPGSWQAITTASAFGVRRSAPAPRARWFDVGQPAGFAIFLVAVAGFVVAAGWVLRVSAYHGVAVLLGASCLFPLFCTGRAGELPPEPMDAARSRLHPIHTWLRKRGLRSTPRIRVPASGAPADELRLLVELESPVRGLESIEVGVDHQRSRGATLVLPFVIVRVQEGSPALDALPAGLLWTRGRDADQRVAVLRPRLPLTSLARALILDVATALTSLRASGAAGGRPVQASSRAARSAGKGASTTKASVRSSPAHAT
jgi:hypothetical protein